MPFTTAAQTWKTPPTQILWECGCRENTSTTPASLLHWCGQPDCLRLATAGVAYTVQQFDWQHSRGGHPTLVSALLRPMVTPLPQILPAPEGGQYFSIDVADKLVKLTESGAEPEHAPHAPFAPHAGKTAGDD